VKSFSGKVAAITGAGSGIGRALSVALAKEGCHLSLSDINEAGLEETAASVRRAGLRVTTARVDVADREAVYAWAERTVADHGGANLVFNNAGVSVASTVEGVSYEDFEWIMGINFWGVVYGTKAFLPHLRASGDGHVVNISSIFGIMAVPGQGTYNATKFAVRGFTEALRQELEMAGVNVSATTVHPGGIKTNIARASRVSGSMLETLKMDGEEAKASFEKMFITEPEEAARTILKAVRRNQRRVLVGPDARFMDLMVRTVPSAYQRVTMAFARRMS